MSNVFSLGRLLLGRGRWKWTLLVLTAVVVMIRLGFWQLDRLEQRRARNAQIGAQWTAPPLRLNTDPIPANLAEFKYRRLTARGRFDPEHQFLLKNRRGPGRPGSDILTPFLIEGRNQAVLVNRGWVPYEMVVSGEWKTLTPPQGTIVITGFVGLDAMPPPTLTTPSLPDETGQVFYVDPMALQGVLPYTLLPFYLVWMPEPGKEGTVVPLKYTPQHDLSEGPHLGYALQWFLFAAAAPVVYVYLLKRDRREEGGNRWQR